MKKTISFHEFQRDFQEVRPDNFSYDGLKALYEYIEDVESDTGDEIELDVIAICCEFSEHDTALEIAKEYGFEPGEDEDEDEQETSAVDYLTYNTQVIVFDSGVIIQDY